VILTWELPLAITGGAIAGLGVYLVVGEFLPAAPALGPALARLQPAPGQPSASIPETGRWGFLARWVRVPSRALAVLGRGTDAYLTSLAVSAICGLVAPSALTFALALGGRTPHLALPVLLGPVCAALFAWLAHRDVLARAERARAEFSRTFCTYVDLVVLELTASGPVQAMERAAKVCHGWVFERIDDALTRARIEMTFPWEQLRRLSDDIGVTELADFAAVMRSAGDSGAHVQATLAEQAESLRDRHRTGALARAEAISARLEMPAALLVIVLAVFMIFPMLARLG
jgi:tight adherence protein C